MASSYSLPTCVYPTIRLVLQQATTKEERDWVRLICREQHYLHREVHACSSAFSYLLIREEGIMREDGTFVVDRRDRVGILVFSRMESTRCKGWYGTLADVVSGWAKQTQWEMLTLSRCWLDPRLQVGGDWYIPKASRYAITVALAHIHYDYLLAYPPAFPEQPWRLRELISYCESDRFGCMLYLFARFKLVRENSKGLKTFSHPLPRLTPEEEKHILDASHFRQRTRARREKLTSASITHEVLFIHRRRVA